MTEYLRTSKAEDATAQRIVEGRVELARPYEARVTVTDALAAFIAKNGVRRFEQGESGSYDGVQHFLLSRGYELRRRVHRFELKKIGAAGRAKTMTWEEVLDFTDQIRAGEGRPTLKRRAA